MEALSRKAEKEKLAELEAMLADATLSGDITDDGSVSFASEAPTPTKRDHIPPSERQGLNTIPPLPWSPQDWSRSNNAASNNHNNNHDNNLGGLVDVTARIYSSSSGESSQEERARRQQQQSSRARRHRGHGDSSTGRKSSGGSHRGQTERDAVVVELRSKLAAARGRLEQKEVVTKSLQRQLDQKGEIESQTQARAEEHLVTALAKASGIKEELARTSQLLVDGALARQHLEQRCSLLDEDLHKSAARTAELEGEASETRAELVRVSGALHARRATDVVDAERAFGEEMQRVQESTAREARALRQDASFLRASLEEMKTRFRKTSGERDCWREEAEVRTSEVNSLRETVTALRQYNENDTIDHLLGQVSRWKRRAEELEHLRRVSSPESTAGFDTNSDTEASHCTASLEAPSPVEKPEEPAETAAALEVADNPTTSPRNQEEVEIVMSEGLDEGTVGVGVLRQELLEAKEALLMAGEEAAAAVLLVQEESRRRGAAEARVMALEGKAEAGAKAARESILARRAAKARALAELKATIQQEMSSEVNRLKSDIEAQRQAEKAHATEEIDLLRGCSGSRERPLGLDKSCQADHAPSTCGIDSADSTADEANVMAPASAMAKAESKRRFEAAVTAASAAEAAATSWARAFSSGTEVIHAALVALCEHANTLLGAGNDERETPGVPLLEGTEAAGRSPPSGQESSAVVPWVPGEVGAEADTALNGLRDSVESAMEGIRLALAEHAALAVARVVAPPVAAAVSLTTTVSQTDSVESRRRESLEHERRTVGVQVDALKGGRKEGIPCAGGAGGAPAWEVGSTGWCPEQQKRDDGEERRRQARDVVLVEELTRKSSALSEALQRAEGEKVNLERSLRKHFEREKAIELERQRDAFDLQVAGLHACAMAIVEDFGDGTT